MFDIYLYGERLFVVICGYVYLELSTIFYDVTSS